METTDKILVLSNPMSVYDVDNEMGLIEYQCFHCKGYRDMYSLMQVGREECDTYNMDIFDNANTEYDRKIRRPKVQICGLQCYSEMIQDQILFYKIKKSCEYDYQ